MGMVAIAVQAAISTLPATKFDAVVVLRYE
jgi:hypothetical protein